MQGNRMNRKRRRIPRSALRFSWAIFGSSLREDLRLSMIQGAMETCFSDKTVHAIALGIDCWQAAARRNGIEIVCDRALAAFDAWWHAIPLPPAELRS